MSNHKKKTNQKQTPNSQVNEENSWTQNQFFFMITSISWKSILRLRKEHMETLRGEVAMISSAQSRISLILVWECLYRFWGVLPILFGAWKTSLLSQLTSLPSLVSAHRPFSSPSNQKKEKRRRHISFCPLSDLRAQNFVNGTRSSAVLCSVSADYPPHPSLGLSLCERNLLRWAYFLSWRTVMIITIFFSPTVFKWVVFTSLDMRWKELWPSHTPPSFCRSLTVYVLRLCDKVSLLLFLFY